MTTSLPTTSPETPLASAATGTAAINGLLDLLAGTSTPLAVGENAANGAATTDFAQLLPTTPGATAPVTAPTPVHAAAAPATALVAPQQTAPLAGNVRSVVLRAPTAASDVIANDATTEVTGSGETVTSAPSALIAPSAPSEAAIAPALPERATLEAALALVLPFAPVVGPETPMQPAPAETSQRPALASSPNLPTSSEPVAGATYRVTLAAPGRAPVEVVLPVTNDPLPTAEIATALVAERGVPAEFSLPRRPAVPPSAPSASVDSTIELPGGARLTVEAPMPSFSTVPVAARLAAPSAASGSMDSANAPVAVAVSSPVASTSPAVAPVRAPLPENSAASALPVAEVNFSPKNFSEKNFLSTAKPSVTPSREEAGIDVAQTPPAMPLSSFAPIATAHAAAPVAALVEKLPVADAPVLAEANMSVAHRAVETVTQVVEAQTASRLQPVPSVQLRFKVGGEDLSVRVELRDGEVRTEFKTDNPELRSALAQEWRAVTGRAESAGRFLEPIITPASTAGQGSGSFSSQQHSSSQHQQQAQQQFRAQAEMFGSVGRSFVPTAESAPASAVVTPLVLPTSHRLSAVA